MTRGLCDGIDWPRTKELKIHSSALGKCMLKGEASVKVTRRPRDGID
jgi:hypothetical protein